MYPWVPALKFDNGETMVDLDPEPLPKPVKEPTQIVQQRRLLNRWSIFILLFVSAVATVLYVSNVIQVNRLLRERESLQHSLDSLHTVNQSVRTEVHRLQSSERITRIASQKLGMTPPTKAPRVLRTKEE